LKVLENINNKTGYWPISFALYRHISCETKNFPTHNEAFIEFVSSRRPASTTHSLPIQQLVDFNEHSCTFGKRIHLTTLSLNSSTSHHYNQKLFILFLILFIFDFLKLVFLSYLKLMKLKRDA
jgi:hypothetical protein